MLDLNNTFNKILNYFIHLTNSMEKSAEESGAHLVEFKETHLFYICLILMRRACSSINTINQENIEQFEYFKYLFDSCLRTHKDKMKALKAFGESSRTNFQINSFHVDFIKSCVYHAASLVSKHEKLKVKPVKMCKHLIELLLAVNEQFEFDVNYFSKLALDTAAEHNLKSLKYILIKSLALSLNSMSAVENSGLLGHFEAQLKGRVGADYMQSLNRLVEFVAFASCDMELNEQLKNIFSEFIQKVIIKTEIL